MLPLGYRSLSYNYLHDTTDNRRRKENSIEGYPPGINLAWKLMPGGNVMGGVPFLGVYLSVEPMIFTPVHPIMGFHLPQEITYLKSIFPRRNKRWINSVINRQALTLGWSTAVDGCWDRLTLVVLWPSWYPQFTTYTISSLWGYLSTTPGLYPPFRKSINLEDRCPRV